MKFINRILTIAFVAFTITASAQDKVERSLESFDRLRVSEGIKVELIRGQSEKAIVEVRGIDLDDVVTEVRGGTLSIYLERDRYRNIDVSVEVYYRSLNSIIASSAADIRADQPITGNSLYVSASSAGSVDIEVDVKDLEVDASSAGSINASGSCITFDVSASSAGTINAFDLKSEDVTARAGSAGSIKTYATKKIDARASSGGSIRYRGEPQKEYTNSSSGGSVRRG